MTWEFHFHKKSEQFALVLHFKQPYTPYLYKRHVKPVPDLVISVPGPNMHAGAPHISAALKYIKKSIFLQNVAEKPKIVKF